MNIQNLFAVRFVLLLLITFLSANAQAKTYEWRLAQTWGNEHLLGFSTTRLSELVEQLSGGRFVIKVISKKEHKNTRGIFDFVKKGDYEMGHSASNFWVKKDPDTMFFSAVPFGMVTPELYSWFYEGGGVELMNKVYKKHGLMSFPGGNSGNQMIGWFNKEIKSVDDLKGLKMRLPGLAGEVMKGLGVEINNVPVSQLKEALSSGQLEAVEFVGPAIDLNLGLQDVAKFYYTGWHSPSSEMQFLVNPEAYADLPEDLQYILKQAMRLAAYDSFTKIVFQNGVKMQELRTQYPNIVLRSFPSDVMRALSAETNRLLQEMAKVSSDGLTQEIIDSMEKHKRRSRLWTRFSDQAYLNNVGL
ncbi:MAG: TRAP transporter substrate-binding protein [Arenicella sp.]